MNILKTLKHFPVLPIFFGPTIQTLDHTPLATMIWVAKHTLALAWNVAVVAAYQFVHLPTVSALIRTF